MKRSETMQVLFFCLIPIGIIILIFSIRSVKKTFSGKIIVEIPYSQKSSEFTLAGPGNYSVWHKGTFFRKAPLDEFKPEILSKSTGLKIRLYPSLFRPNSNNGRTARMELYRFSAPEGKYVLELNPGSSISGTENSIIDLIPAKMVDYDKYFIQIRESQPLIHLLMGIVLIALAGICMIGGLVFGILAGQIFKN
ncbi:MAG: hypothetical protein L0Y76_13275 [Ignavibacteria bacterium]|nr:hypothetical protein [Ignavibacteria bacterium]